MWNAVSSLHMCFGRLLFSWDLVLFLKPMLGLLVDKAHSHEDARLYPPGHLALSCVRSGAESWAQRRGSERTRHHGITLASCSSEVYLCTSTVRQWGSWEQMRSRRGPRI